VSIQTPPSQPPTEPEPNIPLPLLEALAGDVGLKPWQIRFISSCCPEGAEKK
jgi:hypothetical protein